MVRFLLVSSLILSISFTSDVAAQAKNAEFHITVVKRIYGEKSAQPFHGVGVFDLIQGVAPLAGASCPNRSNSSGQITCIVPCKQNDAIPILIRVRPPSDQDLLGGWVAPTAQEVEVMKCVAKPAKLTMLYEDARYALNEFLSKQYFAKDTNQDSGNGEAAKKYWVTEIAEGSPVTMSVSASAMTVQGREELLQLHELATTAAKDPRLQRVNLSSEDKELAEALARWQILSKSALLQSQITQTLPIPEQTRLKLAPTTDLSKFRINLNEANVVLKSAERSLAQQRLADDLSTLKSLPATGPGAAAANQVLETWR